MRNDHKIIQSTIIVTVALFATRFLGLVRESVLAGIYGAGLVSDAFIISFTMPDTILACIGSSLGTVFIPLYQENRSLSDRFTSNIINITAVLGLFLTLLLFCFPDMIVTLFASGFNPEAFELTVTFTRIMVLSTIPILLSFVLKSYLQIHKAFFAASALDGIVNILVIGGILVSKLSGQHSLMAYGAVAGKVICLVFLIVFSGKHHFQYQFYLNIRDAWVKRLLILIAPVFLGIAVLELNTIIDRNFASSLVSGTISAMNYANKVNGIIYTFIGTSIVTVLYPEIVELTSQGRLDDLRAHLKNFIVLLSCILVPLTAYIAVMAEPVVAVLFRHGSFTQSDAVMTAQCVRMYALSYLAANLIPILNRFFYSAHDTKTPTLYSAASVALNIILNFLLVGRFKHIGLSLSTSIASYFSMFLLLMALQKKMYGLHIRSILPEMMKIAVSGSLTCVFLYIVYRFFYHPEYSFVQTTFFCGICAAFTALLYFVFLLLMKEEVCRDIVRTVAEGVKKIYRKAKERSIS